MERKQAPTDGIVVRRIVDPPQSEEIARGAPEPGEELPSVRELAESLGINPHTVHHAYRLSATRR